MNTNFASNFLTQHSFKTLPDGKRVIVTGWVTPEYYLISDRSTEQRLYRQLYFGNLVMFMLMLVFYAIMYRLGVFNSYIWIALFVSLWFLFGGIARGFIIRKEMHSLRRIDTTSETTFFYRNFTNKVCAGTNGSLPSYEIIAYLDIPQSDDKIIMLNYSKPFPNVFRCHLDGSIVWQAKLPTLLDDVYTNIEWTDGKLQAFSRSCLSVLLDENTGRIISGESGTG